MLQDHSQERLAHYPSPQVHWSSFWASFKSTIEDREELSNTQRLHYLRQAVTDPELQLLLHSPAETPDFYLEVVLELKERFNKTREIHQLLSRTLADLSSPKQTRTDLRQLVDLVKRTISSLKATKHYDMDSFLSSIVFSILPSRLQTSWAQHTKKEKGVPPITQLLLFLREHAETLPATSATPSTTPPDTPNRKNNPRKTDRKQNSTRSQGVHAVTPNSSYRWECSLCQPEKHPLHLCPQWATLNLSQRLGHIQAKSLCVKDVIFSLSYRTTYYDHPPTVSLITAKTKVAKLDPLTMPRLELCGDKLLTTILFNTATVLSIPAKDRHCWTDSTIVLAWLDGRDKQLPVFINNRVQFIIPQKLLHHPLWWEGPPWLKQEPAPIPKQPPRKELLEEHSINVIPQHSSIAEDICSMYSNYPCTVSIAAWCLYRVDEFLIPELSVKLVPQTYILTGSLVHRVDELLPLVFTVKLVPQTLHPLLDQNQLLRVGGRLANSSLSSSQQLPTIVDAKDPLILKLFSHLHVTLCHCGPSLLLYSNCMCWVPDASAGLPAQNTSSPEEDSPNCRTS